MTKIQFSILIIVITLGFVLVAKTQTFGSFGITPIAPLVSNCPTGMTNTAMLCPVGSATSYTMYISYNAGTYQLLTPLVSGVTSFNGRTGAVVLTKADVTGTGFTVATTSNSTVQ